MEPSDLTICLQKMQRREEPRGKQNNTKWMYSATARMWDLLEDKQACFSKNEWQGENEGEGTITV